MSGIDQITVHAPTGSAGDFRPVSSSLRSQEEIGLWLRMLTPWLRIGRSLGRCYLSFASWATFIRWYTEPSSSHDWDYSVFYIGDADLLTARYVLELPDLDQREVHAGAGLRSEE